MPIWITILLLLPLTAYAVLLSGAFLFQRRLLYQTGAADTTRRDPWEPYRVEIAGPEGRIEAWLLHADRIGTEPVLLYCCGTSDDAVLACPDFHRNGQPCLLWNYPGYGRSAGTAHQASLYRAAVAVRDWLQQRHALADRQVILFGRSLGTAVALRLAASREPAGLILVAPYDSIAAVAQHQYPWLPAGLLLRDRWRCLSLCSRCRTPLLALISEEDEVVPPARSNALLRAWRGPLDVRRLQHGDHEHMHQHERYWPSIREFARRFRQPTAGVRAAATSVQERRPRPSRRSRRQVLAPDRPLSASA